MGLVLFCPVIYSICKIIAKVFMKNQICLSLLLTIFPLGSAHAKHTSCVQRQLSGEPMAYYLPDQSGYVDGGSKQVYPIEFTPTWKWQSMRLGDRYDNQRRGICKIK